MSALTSIGAILALLFTVLGIAALPVLRRAHREGKRLLDSFRKLQTQNALDIFNLEGRVESLGNFHIEEGEHRVAVLMSRLEAIETAVSTGHLRGEEGAYLKAKIRDELHARMRGTVKSEGAL